MKLAMRVSLAALGLFLGAGLACAQTEISFFYPVAVGGPVTKIIDGFAADFEKENPGIKVKPIYAGTYQETIVKALTAHKSGEPPVTSVLLSTDMFTLIDEDAIVPYRQVRDDRRRQGMAGEFLSGVHGQQPDRRQDLGHSVPALDHRAVLEQGGVQGSRTRPERAPATWAEMVDYAQKLTKKDASGKVTQWGVQIPSSGFPYWLFQGLTTENDAMLMNDAGNEVYFDKPGVIEAVQYWVDLSKKHGVQPAGITEWGTTPKDFFEKKIAMMWTTTGNLTNVKANAKFDFGVAMLPANKRRGRPTGGGNFYIFKKTLHRSSKPRSSSSSGSPRRSAPRSGASTPATSRCAPMRSIRR